MEVTSEQLPRGKAFLDFALGKTLEHAQNGRKDERVVEWARNQIADNGAPYSMLGRAEIIYRAFGERVAYTEDPFDVELIAKPRDVMCLPGADLCLRASDCEESAAALAACLSAVGLQTCIIHQTFPSTNHAITGVWTEEGWKRADPSYYKRFKESGDARLGRHYIAHQERWFDTMTGKLLHTGDGKTTPSSTISDQALVSGKPLHDFVSISGLGAADATATQQVLGAWAAWLDGANKAMNASFQRASDAIQQLQKFRTAMGLPQYDAGWTADLAQTFYGALTTATKDLDKYATEALSGKREATWLVQDGAGALAIVAKPGDTTAYSEGPAGTLVTQSIPANPGSLGIAPLLIVAGAAVIVVGSVAVYLTVAKVCETYAAHVAAQHQQDMARSTQQFLDKGATPEQAAALVDSITKSAPMTAAVPKENELVSLFKTLVTGVAIVAGVGLVYIIGERIIEYRQIKAA